MIYTLFAERYTSPDDIVRMRNFSFWPKREGYAGYRKNL